MYQTSEQFGNLIQQDSRTFYALLYFDGNMITDGISEITIEGGSNSEDDFSIGSAVSRYAKIKMANPGKRIEGKEITVKIGMMVGDAVEYVPMGFFTAEKPKTDEGQITVTAYDRMMKTERPFSTDGLGKTTDTISVLNAVSRITGVVAVTDGLDKITMDRPDGYSCREILGYVSQMYGGFATCNRQGQIEIKTYVDSNYPVDTGRYWDTFEHHDVTESIDKITCYTGKDAEGNDLSVSVGSGTRAISFSNPFMTQSMLDNVWKTLKGYTYMPGTVKIMGDPRLDPWDVLTVCDLNGETYKVPVMDMTHEFDGGLITSVEAVGRSEVEQESGYKGPTTKEMDRYYAQLVVIDKALINKLNVDTANITYATIKNLEVTKERVEEIYGEYGEFQKLTVNNFSAANGRIDILASNYANIKNLLSGSAGIGDLQNIHLTSDNAVIDTALIRTAVMESVSIADLLAGTISTNKFKIMSDDGGIQISGATQQWKDDNGVVRMQAGRDAQGNFTFELFDETGKGVLIDSTGVQPGAIADGLIVNEMVSDTANIAASKLDIDSLFTAINDSTQVIKSNRIWLDDSGQSLNQAYSKMTQNITEIESTASSASDSASAAADAAKKALETLSGISTLDAMSASLNNDAHVVHTYTDGTGGDYSSCYTVFSVFLGDTDVSDHIDEIKAVASDGITGIWNPQTRKYQVTAMSTDSGYVDISALYGLEGKVLLVGGKGLVIGGKTMIVKSMGSWITKRFSVSKAKDGKIGLSYDLRVSTQIIRKQKDDKTLKPANVTFSAYKNDNGSVSSYSGKFQIEESKDFGKTYEIKYGSSSAELLTVYTPSSPDVQIIRCSLYDSSGVQLLDTQTVSIVSDAAGLAQDIAAVDQKAQEAKETIQTTSQEVTQIKSGMEGFETKLSKTTTDLQGVTDGTLLYNTKCQDNGDGTTTVSAALYKAGVEVTKEYPAAWFSWSRRTEQGEAFLQYGYSVTVNNNDYMFGGVVIGQFTRYIHMALVVGGKLLVVGSKAICLQVDA